MEIKDYGGKKLLSELNTVDTGIDTGLDAVLGPEYKSYVKGCKKTGKKPKTFNEWVNS